MKKQGDTWKKFKDIDKAIIKILKKRNFVTTGIIKKDLESKGFVTTWVTVKSYLMKMLEKEQIIQIPIEGSNRFLWQAVTKK